MEKDKMLGENFYFQTFRDILYEQLRVKAQKMAYWFVLCEHNMACACNTQTHTQRKESFNTPFTPSYLPLFSSNLIRLREA